MHLSRSIAALAFALTTSACSRATTGAGPASQSGGLKSVSNHCQLPAADSVFLANGPAFLSCDVDKQAKMVSQMPFPDFKLTRSPAGGGTCYEVEMEFVVGADGAVETQTARVLRTNDTEFAEAFIASLSRRRYSPAMKGGFPAREIFKEQQKAAVMIAPAGSKPSGRPPNC